MARIRQRSGYSLIELVVVIVILAILATVTMRSLRGANDARRAEETRREMDRLAWAIAGNPETVSGGGRTDYGYVGDIGSLPPNLTALVVNPGFGTWHGPYLQDEFTIGSGAGSTDATTDGWGQPYAYAGGAIISSTGGGSTLTRRIAASTDDLLRNLVAVVVTDMNHLPPGAIHRDSVRVILSYPDGVGGIATVSAIPRPDGLVTFDSVPAGIHPLRIAYLPASDTLRRQVNVPPGTLTQVTIQYPAEVW